MPRRETMSVSTRIHQTPAVVFEYLSDVSKHPEWSPKPLRFDGLAPGPVKAGDSFTSHGVIPGDKDHVNEVTVTECVPTRRLVLDAREKDEHFIHTFELEPEAASTVLTRTIDAPKPGLPLLLVWPLIRAAIIRPDVTKGLRMLKENLERG